MMREEKVFKGNFKKIWAATCYSVCHMKKLLWGYIPMFNVCNDFFIELMSFSSSSFVFSQNICLLWIHPVSSRITWVSEGFSSVCLKGLKKPKQDHPTNVHRKKSTALELS